MIKEYINILLLAIALSLDTFSLSISIGITKINKKQIIFYSLLVGLLHFILPLLGNYIGIYILKILSNTNIVLSIVLLFIALEISYETLIKKETIIKINKLNLIIMAISVSIDSLTTGLGISAITNNIYIVSFLFSIFSFSFTIL